MSIMDGLEMISQLPSQIYSFIIISGHFEFTNAQKDIQCNGSEYLLKSFDHTLFTDALKRAIEDLEIKRFFINKKDTHETNPFRVIDLDIKVESITLNIALEYIRDIFQKNHHEGLTTSNP